MKMRLVLLSVFLTAAINCCYGQAISRSSEMETEMVALVRDAKLADDAAGPREKKEQQLRKAQDAGNKAEIALRANQLAWRYALLGLADKSIEHFNLAATTLREQGNKAGAAVVLAEIGYFHVLRNKQGAAISYFEQSLQLDSSSARLASLAYYLEGRCYTAQGMHTDAKRAYHSSLRHAERGQNIFLSAHARMRLAEELIRDSHDAEADRELAVALKLMRKTGDRNGTATILGYQGIVDFLGGKYDDALAHFNQSNDMVPRISVLKLIRDTYLKLLSSSDARNDMERRSFYSQLYYQYRDSVQAAGDPARTATRYKGGHDEAPDFLALLARKKNPYAGGTAGQLEYNRKLNEAELKLLKAEETLALENKENEAEIRERETHIARLQKEMAEQDLSLSRKELDATRQRQLIVVLVISAVAIIIITLITMSRLRQKKRLHEEVHKAFEELSATHETLKRTQDQLVHSEKMASLGQLTAGIAHEIQNPLNFVNNFSEVSVELLQELEGHASESQKATLHTIRENLDKIAYHGKRADSIIKGMLLHSRNGSHEKQLTDLNNMAAEIIQLAYHGMRTREPGFHCNLTENLDKALPLVPVVPQDISRVLLNLLGNAFYALAEKKKMAGNGFQPEVTLTSRKSGQGVEISVRDNGDGIDAGILDRIFVPFFTTKPPGDGTGLGLSISYDIVTKGHGGTLKVDTQKGVYTEFTLFLPTTATA